MGFGLGAILRGFFFSRTLCLWGDFANFFHCSRTFDFPITLSSGGAYFLANFAIFGGTEIATRPVGASPPKSRNPIGIVIEIGGSPIWGIASKNGDYSDFLFPNSKDWVFSGKLKKLSSNTGIGTHFCTIFYSIRGFAG